MKRMLLSLMVLVVAACAGAPPRPTAEQLMAADYGAFPDDYQKLIATAISANLIDPYSAQFTFTEPKKAWNNYTGVTLYGWHVCGTVNAKNRFGGYVGAKPYYAMIHNGKIVTLISTPRTIPDSVKLGMMAGLLEQEGPNASLCKE